ncbi:hypothetical protein [Bacillus cereus]|uniref:hypothetical protein n=1 Tax=Bacillus cereus TaxID=1396 RepID=UPI003D64AA3A
MKKLVITSVIGIGLLGNSVLASASTVDYSKGKEMASNIKSEEEISYSTANLAWAVGGYLTGKAVDAAGNWLGKQAQKANAQSIYSAAGKGKYACYVSSNDQKIESVSFGR